MDEGRVFGRTSLGTQEILQKSGRLTQSERLVLIVLGDQIRFKALHSKVPSLSPERVESALVRLVELDLAYEVLMPVPGDPREQALPAGAVRAFLVQGEMDPVTVMASQEQIDMTDHQRALNDAVGRVLATAGENVAVPLGKLFPELKPGGHARTGAVGPDRMGQRERTESRLGALEQAIEGTRVPSLDAPPAPKISRRQREATGPVEPTNEVVIVEAEQNSTAGGVMMLIGGLGAAVVVATLLVYALR